VCLGELGRGLNRLGTVCGHGAAAENIGLEAAVSQELYSRPIRQGASDAVIGKLPSRTESHPSRNNGHLKADVKDKRLRIAEGVCRPVAEVFWSYP